MLYESSDKRQRKRAPLSCLNCKKRKVRCDKKKPCSGCIKNNVPHLCVYVEPGWVDEKVKLVAGTTKELSAEDVKKSPEYLGLKAAMEETIQRQQAEIASLRNQLQETLHQGLFSKSVSWSPQVSVLRKLDPLVDEHQAPHIQDDTFYTLKGLRTFSRRSGISLRVILRPYGWLNLIKLDPQLTSLWFKITSLQKSYYLYKQNLMNKAPQEPRKQISNGLDATNDNNSCGHSKCPVVACEFNAMVEESSQKSKISMTRSNSSSVSQNDENVPKPEVDSIPLLTLLQELWAGIRAYGRGNEPLNHDQILFLVSFYLNLPSSPSSVLLYELESRHLFRFYRNHILSLIQVTQEGLKCNLSVYEPHMSDKEVFDALKLKGVYLSMLALIVEESLDILRLRAGMADEVLKEFHTLFPMEALHQGLGYKYTRIPNIVKNLLLGATNPLSPDEVLCNLLPCISAILGLLNRCISLYKRPGISGELQDLFTPIFAQLVDILDAKNQTLHLWYNPSQLHFHGKSQKRDEELRVHYSHVWTDVMRLVNLVLFNMAPICKPSDKVLEKMRYLYDDFEQAVRSDAHLSFLSFETKNLASTEREELLTSLNVYYLMSRAYLMLQYGIINASDTSVKLSDIKELILSISRWAADMSITKLRMVRYFEVRSMFYYLEFFLSYVSFLQCEDLKDEEGVSRLVPSLISKCLDLNKFLQGSLMQFSKTTNAQYILYAVAEILLRISHLIVGILIRFKAEDNSSNKLVYRVLPESKQPVIVMASEKGVLIKEMDHTLQILDSVLNKEVSLKVIKIWRFYMTFVRNSHKMSPAAYARIHADVFRSGKLIDACPVIGKPDSNDTAIAGNSKCPVPLDTRAELKSDLASITPYSENGDSITVGKCPVAHSKPSPTNARKRLCPFDHDALRTGSVNQSFNESNMRGGVPNLKKDTSTPPKLPSPGPSIFTEPRTLPPDPSLQTQNSFEFDALDWDNLPNFDFDLMNDETLMDQINGGDFNNAMIEGMFQ